MIHYSSIISTSSRNVQRIVQFFCSSQIKNTTCTTTNTISNQNAYRERWPELYQDHVRFYLGEGDGACANVGSKCTSSNRIAMTIGTSAAVRVCIPMPIIPTSTDISNNNSITDKDPETIISRGLFCYRINSEYVLVGGALTDGGSVVEWIQNLLQLHTSPAKSSFDPNLEGKEFLDLDSCMKQVEQLMANTMESFMSTNENTDLSDHPRSSSISQPPLIVIPFLSGERSTGFRANATGCILGLTRQTTSAMFVKACLEGVVLRLHAIVSLLLPMIETSPSKNDEKISTYKDDNDHLNNNDIVVVVSGTALEKNRTWRQMIADCTGYHVILDKEGRTESTSRGVARIITLSYLRDPTNMQKGVFQNVIQEEALVVEERTIPNNATRKISSGRKRYWEGLGNIQEAFIDVVSSLW